MTTIYVQNTKSSSYIEEHDSRRSFIRKEAKCWTLEDLWLSVKKKEWKEAMMEEYQSIMKNDIWEIVPRPEGKSVNGLTR